MASKKNLAKEVENQIRSRINPVLKELAATTRDELYNAANSAIADFYRHYNPTYYQRHYYNLPRSYRKSYTIANYKKYFGGLLISYTYMDNIYLATTEGVFNAVINKGFHGLDDIYAPPLSPTPIERIYKRRDEIAADISSHGAIYSRAVAKVGGL